MTQRGVGDMIQTFLSQSIIRDQKVLHEYKQMSYRVATHWLLPSYCGPGTHAVQITYREEDRRGYPPDWNSPMNMLCYSTGYDGALVITQGLT